MNLIIAANWKMYKTNQETKEYVEKFKVWQGELSGSQVIICPPFTALSAAGGEALFKTAFHLGARTSCGKVRGGVYRRDIPPADAERIWGTLCYYRPFRAPVDFWGGDQ